MNHTQAEDANKDVDLQSRLITGVISCFLLCLLANTLQIVAESPALSQSFLSPVSANWISLNLLGGTVTARPQGQQEIRVSYLFCLFISTLLYSIPAGILWLRSKAHRIRQLNSWISLTGIWGILWIAGLIAQSTLMLILLQATLVFWISLTIAGSLYEVLRSPDKAVSKLPETNLKVSPINFTLLGLVLLYLFIFTAMNWGLWFNLRLPHGDSAMYEEHLWNVLHGKGFRSYLDQGLFWGEHIQFVHLFLIPAYLLWPSQLLLELCESLALAIGTIPIYWMAVRNCGSRKAALFLSAAYLCYFPMQFLDIAVDLKTFRPIAFGVPIVLFALDQIERKHWGIASGLLLLSLSCKEDYAIVIFSIGLSLLIQWWWHRKDNNSNLGFRFGLGYLICGPLYLLAALKLIRWFRSGVEVHYAGYFSKFGESTSEIIWTMLTNPLLLGQELLTINSLVYVLAILLPLGFLPMLSPIRFFSTAPMFVLLCLNELAQDPRHHFHAPLVPLLFWAAATGLGNSIIRRKSHNEDFKEDDNNALIISPRALRQAQFAFSCAVATSFWFSISPLGIAFWDPGSNWNGWKLYVPDERATSFSKIETLIPQNSRVASTDYVHPRFTHYERSYDYSHYARTVSGGTTNVPADTDYIVIDTRHPYSEIHELGQVRELREQPDQWELLPDETNGYFIVLKKREPQ
ncbi:DUF2079 domain-containing protein [uncultured Rubinisphaera sp.]|uniref:DUF2079 domain-containing protein n=2 Tax=Rubinisphaera TaxID=1649490 RepID=UPI0030DCE1DB|tara:strand:- start:3144 stop:5210 length:2067 start_codon:yes stop_codon:yes gene_type:complete